MKLAEGFINLVIKGGDKSKKDVKGLIDKIEGLRSSSLATKASILALFYGIQRMMSASSSFGMGMKQFANYTGLSVDQLQRWQSVGRNFGVSGDEITSSIKGIQDSMMSLMTTGRGPEGLQRVADTLAAIGKPIDMKRMNDTFYMAQKIQEFLASGLVPPALANQMAKSFGLSENFIAAMRSGAFSFKNLSSATDILTSGQINALSRVDAQWEQLGFKIKLAFSDFVSRDGGRVVSDLTKITVQIIKMIGALTRLAEKVKVFEVLSESVKGAEAIFKILGGENVASSPAEQKRLEKEYEKNKDTTRSKVSDFILNIIGSIVEELSTPDFEAMRKIKKQQDAIRNFSLGNNKPMTSTNDRSPQSITNNIKIEQSFSHGGDNSKEVGRETEKAIRSAFRQMPSQGVFS